MYDTLRLAPDKMRVRLIKTKPATKICPVTQHRKTSASTKKPSQKKKKLHGSQQKWYRLVRYPDNSAKDTSAKDTSANANSAKETTVRLRQKCEGQECECNFSAIGQNSEMIQIVQSRSFCLQDGLWFSFFFFFPL